MNTLSTIIEITNLLEEFNQSYSNGHLEFIDETLVHDRDIITFGTDTEERFIGWEAFVAAATEQYDHVPNLQVRQSNLNVKLFADGKAAYATANVYISGQSGEKTISIPEGRVTYVLELRGHNWQILHLHYSEGI